MEKLHKIGVAYDVSPLHDQDLNAEGEKKKPHYHVVFDWGSGATTSGTRAIECFDIIGGVYPDPEKNRKLFLESCKVKKVISAQRYLCHLDEHDPNKVRYDVNLVKSGHQEIAYQQRVLRTMEKDEQIMMMVDFVIEEGIDDFATFVLMARKEHPDWIHAVINERAGTFVNRFINGLAQKQRNRREEQTREIQHRKYLLEIKTWENVSEEPIEADFVAPYDEHLDYKQLYLEI